MLIVPGLMALGLPQRLAHGTSLAAIAPVACAGVAGYALGGSVDWTAAGIIVVGAAGGAVVGTRALRRIPERRLAIAFALFLLATAVTLPFQAAVPALRVALDAASVALLVAIGLGAGALSGLLGVGGGIVTIPALTLLLGIAPSVARGTSLAVIIPTAIVGSIQNVRARNADLRAATVVGVPGMVSSLAASLLSVRLDPLLSTVLFAALCVAVAARMLLLSRRARASGIQPPRPNRLPRRPPASG